MGLCNDSIGAIEGNMPHKHLKVIALELRRLALMRKNGTKRLGKLISKIANDKTWTPES